MVTEDYVSFEVAKLLKEKEFNEVCMFAYTFPDGESAILDKFYKPITNKELDEDACVAPTHQMALKWLRKVYKIFIEVRIHFMPKVQYRSDILEFNDLKDVQWLDDLQVLPYKDTYEEAVEEALKYTFENLI